MYNRAMTQEPKQNLACEHNVEMVCRGAFLVDHFFARVVRNDLRRIADGLDLSSAVRIEHLMLV